MDHYHIAASGVGFQVVETTPDGHHRTMDGFPTEADARGWLEHLFQLLGLIDAMTGEPTPR